MPNDPFASRAPSEGAPYDNALTVTRADGGVLPVIPCAFYLPGVEGAADESRPNHFHTAGGQDPCATYTVRVEMQNGEQINIITAGYSVRTGSIILNHQRIRRILWDQSPGLQAVTLLW
ncbi:MAG: hypothetical protein ACU0DH_07030 [Paracoccus sp. (in: a-proteobacteria)]|uniref:hypothetical protein n=1 Tax=Paracoccus sp. TaxID=267 RepID=UPI00405806E0